jgi:hypothetical protein
MLHGIIFTIIYLFVTLGSFFTWYKELPIEKQRELCEEFWWRCIPGYIFSIFHTFCASHLVLRWDLSFGAEIGWFIYCLFIGGIATFVFGEVDLDGVPNKLTKFLNNLEKESADKKLAETAEKSSERFENKW